MGCAIVPINRPSGKLADGMKFFSGKHHSYCVKVEIGVNPKNGLASTISDFYPGSVHDYEIFKNHYPTFSQHLKGSKIMADSAYMGAKAELGAIVTKPHGTPYLSKHRVIVEKLRSKRVDYLRTSHSILSKKGSEKESERAMSKKTKKKT
ncbi:putative DDE superfamily endonuclease [Monocercomonoides exilis]|uniref:putative DDE superfamily endonuclease n=1 Tax=Monocercomonoides exilis TaxID=2049356 RepID=UPI00355A1DEB|nr:putative DDE superfamily endonuclease [Monocercomonoides exilis]|eukprot:MONOS_9959.1-p1 / transcript=MONOS_9959.1 / gene=MONOS_9959 / organism=Monocercomonoides_exilis_PA203 / gene_product=unspecified product / transcript_product=unspecified product / location=Mono_scaffold00431:45021-45610(-) / protein_length=149 / sequence_SO=supercontig / SO=protein_coding / is_pseudo=false